VRVVGRTAAVVALLALGAVLAFAAHRSFGAASARSDRWEAAVARARQAHATKPLVPALRLRGEALETFSRLARSGPAAERSRAELLAALLELESADLDAAGRDERLGRALDGLQRAIRLDPANDELEAAGQADCDSPR
jgi:hypothetical protein